MPAKSKKQRRFMGLVKSIQEGHTAGSGRALEVAKTMSPSEVDDFASTKEDDLPVKAAEDVSSFAKGFVDYCKSAGYSSDETRVIAPVLKCLDSTLYQAVLEVLR